MLADITNCQGPAPRVQSGGFSQDVCGGASGAVNELGRCLSSRQIFGPVEFSSGPADEVLGPKVGQKRGLTVAETAEPDSGPGPAIGRNTKVRRGPAHGSSTSLAAVLPCFAISPHLRNTLPPHLALVLGDDAPGSFFTVFDKLEGALRIPRPHSWTPEQCRGFGITMPKVPHPTARIVEAPLEGWPVPQIIVSSASAVGGHRAVVLCVVGREGLRVCEARLDQPVDFLVADAIFGFGLPWGSTAAGCYVDGVPVSCRLLLSASADRVLLDVAPPDDEFSLFPVSRQAGSAGEPASRGSGRGLAARGGILSDAGALGLLDSSHAAPASCRADAFTGRSLPLSRLPVWAWPKHRRSRRQAILLGSAVASTPRPVLDVASAPVSLGASALVQVAGGAVSPDSVQPYTSFDEVNNDRTLQAQAAWTDRHFVEHAVESARLPGCPLGRMLQVTVSGFVTPQVAITQDRRLAHRRAVIFDLRRLGLGVETRDVIPGHSLAHALALLQSPLDIVAFLLHLRSGALCCSVNHEIVLPDTALGTAADVVICDVTPTLDASTRPPTPPVPESSEDDTATWTQQDGEGLSAGHASLEHTTGRWNRRFGPSASVALTEDSRCTVFDPLYHVEILVSSACRHAGALLQHALASHTELGSLRDGRVVAYPIPEWPQPQVVVHSLLHGSYVMLPVSVGDKVCTLSILREASIFELLLQLEGRCGIARAYRHLVSKGLLDVHVNGRRARNVFERDALLFADTAVVGAAPALRPANSPSMLFPNSPEYVSPEAFVTIHRPALPPSQVFLPPFLTPEDVKADLRAQGLLGAGGSLQIPLVSPVLVDGGAHFLALSGAEVEAGCSYMIMDLRRVVHPPFVTFWTTRAVTQFSVAHIEDILLAEFPSVAPVVNVFVDDIRADTVVLARRFPSGYRDGRASRLSPFG